MLQANFLNRHARSASLSRGAILLGLLLLQACGGRYQAPLDDQSRVLERQAPPIYSTTGSSSNTAPIPPQNSTARSTSASTVAAGVQVQPAPGVSVNVAPEPGAIRRSTIGRAPIDGATSTSPAATSPTTSSPTSSSSTTTEPTRPLTNPSSSVAPSASSGQTHIVVRGDTLYSIAWAYSVDYRALALANNLAPPYTIYPNQQLNVNISSVSNNAIENVPNIPVAPAGDPAVNVGVRPIVASENRRVGNVPTRVVEGVSWQWPVEGRVLRGFSSNASSTSKGIDIGGRRGEPVYAAADGDVVYSGRGIQGQGDLIIIRHSARYLSAYSHNSNMVVTEGARIRAGDKIAEVGTDPRGSELLHFEVRVDGKPADPSQYLPPSR